MTSLEAATTQRAMDRVGAFLQKTLVRTWPLGKTRVDLIRSPDCARFRPLHSLGAASY